MVVAVDLEKLDLKIVHDLIFFFQAEDGIRDPLVTGVQTCALPISGGGWGPRAGGRSVRAGGYGPPSSRCGSRAPGRLARAARPPPARGRGRRSRGRPQIGRASCRERMEVKGATGCVEERMTVVGAR